MDRDKILMKSKKDMPKEEYKQTRYFGQELGTVVFSCLAGTFIILDFSRGKISYDTQCLFWGYFASITYAKYYNYKRKSTLIGFLASTVATILFLAKYILAL